MMADSPEELPTKEQQEPAQAPEEAIPGPISRNGLPRSPSQVAWANQAKNNFQPNPLGRPTNHVYARPIDGAMATGVLIATKVLRDLNFVVTRQANRKTGGAGVTPDNVQSLLKVLNAIIEIKRLETEALVRIAENKQKVAQTLGPAGASDLIAHILGLPLPKKKEPAE